ncbi:MAG: DNA mismatch repair endonuclease MutL, partial [Thermomicrobiales bacterium]
MPIRLLTPETIGKIAAGEVVERASSVVKELVENAIDARSTRINVEVRGGGVDLIEVSDDGIGIDASELNLALERHATSKLTQFDDLDMLATLGFRGEALASVAAVSDFTIKSRTALNAAGTLKRVEFGRHTDERRISTSPGTTVTVRDLFGNVPARRKFLRQPSTEHGYVGRVVAAYACAYPGIQFSYTVDGRRAMLTDGSGDLVSAATAVYGLEAGKAALRLEPLDDAAAVPGVDLEG